MTKKEAIELSIKKWEWIAENPEFCADNLLMAVPEVKGLVHYCGLCEKYLKEDYSCVPSDCEGCPLAEIDKSCFDDNSAFAISANIETRENALIVLNLIKSL